MPMQIREKKEYDAKLSKKGMKNHTMLWVAMKEDARI